MPFVKTHTGPLFRDFVRAVVSRKNARSYLEVGVRDGATLSQIDCPSIGVDPAFQFNCNPVGSKKILHLFQMTSDQFFREHDPRELLRSEIDVVFLDGLHQFEFLLRDFINSEAVCHANSLIMLDDCLPANAEMTQRYHDASNRTDKALASWWTGDVWKLLPILKKYRPDLRITAVDTTPTGNICITNLSPQSTTLKENYYKIVDEYMDICMGELEIERFYQENPIISASNLLYGFESSIFIGS